MYDFFPKMVKYSDFDIEIESRKNGTYKFSYVLEDEFFAFFEKSLIEHGRLEVDLEFVKKNKLLEFIYTIKGEIELVCDRCLDTFMHPVDVKNVQYVKIGDEYKEIDEQTIMIPSSWQKVNVAQWLYEDAALTIPYRKVHPLDENGNSTCNPEMLKILDKYAVEEADDEVYEDPRWSELKKLLNKEE